MRALIVADIEGVHGVYNLTDTKRNAELLTKEVETCILALHNCNITRITVCDSHNKGNSICLDTLSKYNIELLSQLHSLAELEHEDYDFAILIGFHGMNGSDGILAHTLRPDIRGVRLANGVEIGEVELICRWLGHLNIPVILVVGDVEATREGNFFDSYRHVCSGGEKWNKIIFERIQIQLVHLQESGIKVVKCEKIVLEFDVDLGKHELFCNRRGFASYQS